jgi:hypothetical protein
VGKNYPKICPTIQTKKSSPYALRRCGPNAAEGEIGMSENQFPPDGPLLTRRDIPEFIRQEIGIPVTKSTVDKTRMYKTGPKPAGFYGKTELFTRPEVKEWALKLFTDKPTKLGAG